MLPPPTTIPTWTPRPWTSATWRAMNAQNGRVDAVLAVAEQRLAGQLEQDAPVAQRRSPRRAAVAAGRSQLLPERVAGEAADADVLADRGDPLGDQLADGPLLVAERLVVQADLREPLLELAVDDLGADVLGLLLDGLVGEQLGPLGREDRPPGSWSAST